MRLHLPRRLDHLAVLRRQPVIGGGRGRIRVISSGHTRGGLTSEWLCRCQHLSITRRTSHTRCGYLFYRVGAPTRGLGADEPANRAPRPRDCLHGHLFMALHTPLKGLSAFHERFDKTLSCSLKAISRNGYRNRCNLISWSTNSNPSSTNANCVFFDVDRHPRASNGSQFPIQSVPSRDRFSCKGGQLEMLFQTGEAHGGKRGQKSSPACRAVQRKG